MTNLTPSGPGTPAPSTLTVVNHNAFAYTVNGVDNPDLTLIRGHTYTFQVNASGHPFAIKSVQGPGAAICGTRGVSNNGTEVGNVTFVVPLDAPDTLYYDCEIHSAMTGTLFIIDPSAGNGSNLAATQTVAGPLTAGSTLTFTVTINNTGVSDQTDNPGDEFSENPPLAVDGRERHRDLGRGHDHAALAWKWRHR